MNTNPSRNHNSSYALQGMPWELPLRGKEVQSQVQGFERAGDGYSLEDIKKRMDVFLSLNKEIISPLLLDGYLDLEARGRIQPYKLVQKPLA